jgi:WD40 repeat protein
MGERPEESGGRDPASEDTVLKRPASALPDGEPDRQVVDVWAETVVPDAPLGATLKGGDIPVEERATLLASGSRARPKLPELGDYELLDVIGEGGMGVVYRARQKSLDREIALKASRPSGDQSKQATFRGMFSAEAIVTGNLDHPNIVPIHSLETDSEGHTFYTMKRVLGRSWEDRIEALTLEENLEILLRVCDAIAFAHSHGVIHRDLKPANVMLGDYGEVLVMDWGLAASVESYGKAEHISHTHHIGGTPAYMAPEQACNDLGRIGRATDIYLLGGILYRIVSGHPPHSGAGAMSCIVNASQNVIRPTSQSGELVDIALKAMNTRPEDRHADVAEFQREIRNYLAHAESIRLAGRAESLLENAVEHSAYEQFSRAIFAFQDALTLWQGNERAQTGVRRARRAYAEAALAGGAYELALSALAEEPQETDLRGRILAAIESRERHRRAVRRWKAGAAWLAGLLFLALTVGFFWIRAERDRTETAREQAVAAREAEGQQRRVAEREAYFAQVRLAGVKVQERAFDEADRLLNRCPAELRGWEWGFIRSLCHQDSFTYTGHGAQVEALAASPDGRTIASGDWRGRIHLWNAEDGELIRAIDAHTDIVNDLTFGPDGSWLASASDDGTAAVWDAATGERRALLQGHTNEVWAVAASKDGRRLATASMDGTLRVWSLPGGELQAERQAPKGGVTAAAFSPDGRLAYAYGVLESPGGITVLRPDDWQEDVILAGHSKHINALAFSPDGATLASGGWDGEAILWDMGGRRSRERLHHDGPVFAVAFSADGERFATAGEDRTVHVWDPRNGRAVRRFVGHSGSIGALAFLGGGSRIASGSTDGTVKLWDLDRPPVGVTTLTGHKGAVAGLAFSPDGSLLASASQDATVGLWSVATGAPAGRLDSPAGAASGAAFLPDGKVAVACWEGKVVVFDPAGQGEPLSIDAHKGVARCVAASSDGRLLVSGGWDGWVRLWLAASGEEKGAFDLGGVNVQAVAVSPDGALVAAAGRDGTVRAWRVAGGEEAAHLAAHAGWARAVAFSPDGRLLATAGDDSLVRLWDAETWSVTATLKGHTKWIKCVAFSPDGTRLVSADDGGSVKVWDVASGRDLIAWPAHEGVIWAVAFSPDGRVIASGGADGTVKLWRSPGP